MVEALTPKPSTSIDIQESRALWGNKMIMWEGIPSILTPVYSEEDLRVYIKDLYRAVAPGDRFILGFGDNVRSEALLHRIKWIVEFHEEHGRYPIGMQ